VPTILTTVIEERGGYLIEGFRMSSGAEAIDRTFSTPWQDERVVDM